MNWEALCVSKKDGGLGFRDFGGLNVAILGKKWWHLMQNPDLLSFRIFQAH